MQAQSKDFMHSHSIYLSENMCIHLHICQSDIIIVSVLHAITLRMLGALCSTNSHAKILNSYSP